jgi:hypothetical protein
MISEQQNKRIWNFWGKYHKQLEEWVGQETIENLFNSQMSSKEISIQFDRLKNAAIKEHISSTHQWVKDTQHKRKGNFYDFPLECKVCGQAASDYDEVYVDFEKVSKHPSRDMHGYRMYRTCQQVLDAKKKARSSRKGKRCLSCNTYDCVDLLRIDQDE